MLCDNANLLQLSVAAIVLFSHFGRVTGLLARLIYYRVMTRFSYLKTALFLFTFSLNDRKGTRSPRQASL
jgi:hypothetical protein